MLRVEGTKALGAAIGVAKVHIPLVRYCTWMFGPPLVVIPRRMPKTN